MEIDLNNETIERKYLHENESNRAQIYVDNLPTSMTKDQFKELFVPYGYITYLKFLKHKKDAKTGYGFVAYSDINDSFSAIKNVNGKTVDSHYIRASFARPENQILSTTNLYVCGLPLNFQSDQLKELFTPFGEISETNVLSNPLLSDSKGVGFVHFLRPEDAKAAVNLMNNVVPSGMEMPLLVKFARDVKKTPKKNKPGEESSSCEGENFNFIPSAVCKYFQSGKCNRGSECNYSHLGEECVPAARSNMIRSLSTWGVIKTNFLPAAAINNDFGAGWKHCSAGVYNAADYARLPGFGEDFWSANDRAGPARKMAQFWPAAGLPYIDDFSLKTASRGGFGAPPDKNPLECAVVFEKRPALLGNQTGVDSKSQVGDFPAKPFSVVAAEETPKCRSSPTASAGELNRDEKSAASALGNAVQAVMTDAEAASKDKEFEATREGAFGGPPEPESIELKAAPKQKSGPSASSASAFFGQGAGSANGISKTNLYVSQFPREWAEAELEEIFSEFGEIDKIRILTPENADKNRGVGFVHFKHAKSALEAMKTMQNFVPQRSTKQMIVKFANQGIKTNRLLNVAPGTCKFWLKGECARGEQCCFKHNAVDLMVQQSVPPALDFTSLDGEYAPSPAQLPAAGILVSANYSMPVPPAVHLPQGEPLKFPSFYYAGVCDAMELQSSLSDHVTTGKKAARAVRKTFQHFDRSEDEFDWHKQSAAENRSSVSDDEIRFQSTPQQGARFAPSATWQNRFASAKQLSRGVCAEEGSAVWKSEEDAFGGNTAIPAFYEVPPPKNFWAESGVQKRLERSWWQMQVGERALKTGKRAERRQLEPKSDDEIFGGLQNSERGAKGPSAGRHNFPALFGKTAEEPCDSAGGRLATMGENDIDGKNRDAKSCRDGKGENAARGDKVKTGSSESSGTRCSGEGQCRVEDGVEEKVVGGERSEQASAKPEGAPPRGRKYEKASSKKGRTSNQKKRDFEMNFLAKLDRPFCCYEDNVERNEPSEEAEKRLDDYLAKIFVRSLCKSNLLEFSESFFDDFVSC